MEMKQLLSVFDGENPVIEVFHEGPDEPFICSVVGEITIDSLQRIEDEVYDVLDRGYGIYMLKCIYNPSTYIDGGFSEGEYWEFDVLGFEVIG